MTRVHLLLACLAAILTSGCAVLNQDKRSLTSFFDEHLAPESDAARIALAPVAIPVGLTALVIDGFVVNPVSHLGDAATSAEKVAFREVRFVGLWEIVVFPMRVVTCTAIFAYDEIGYCTLPFW